jgi:hypothetical protein
MELLILNLKIFGNTYKDLNLGQYKNKEQQNYWMIYLVQKKVQLK